MMRQGLFVEAWCSHLTGCSRSAHLDPEPLIRRIGNEYVARVGDRLKCSRCGNRAIVTRPEVFDGRIGPPRRAQADCVPAPLRGGL